MNHPPDQDLLLLAHRSLNLVKTLAARWHVWRCPECRLRYRELNSLSFAVASALRIGLPSWKPAVMALKVKLLIGVVALATGTLVTEVVIANRTGPAGSCDVSGHYSSPAPKIAQPMTNPHVKPGATNPVGGPPFGAR